MKILVVTQYFYPEQFHINEIVVEMARRGHEITVLTGLPNYPSGKIFDGYNKSYQGISNYFGVKVIRCKLRPRLKGTWHLFLNYLSFVIQATKKIRKIKHAPDLIIVYGLSPITQAIPAIKYGKKHHISILYYCLDLWPAAVLGEQNGHKQLGTRNPIYLIANLISRYVYKNVSCVAIKCKAFENYLVSFCKVEKNKIRLLYEHAESIYLNVHEMPENNGVIDFMFLGNIGKIQNCDHIVEAFSRIKTNKPIKLHFVGDGTELEKIKSKVKLLKLSDQVGFYGHCSINDTIKYYNIADICVLSLSNRTITGLTLPAKLLSYMAAARPIIASINGEAKSIIEDAKCGIVSLADDIDGLASLMQKAVDNLEIFFQLGINGRQYFKKYFTLTSFVDNLEKILEGGGDKECLI